MLFFRLRFDYGFMNRRLDCFHEAERSQVVKLFMFDLPLSPRRPFRGLT